jgi:hypothetical protein
MNWNMVEYLPDSVQMHFSAVIAGYMSAIYQQLVSQVLCQNTTKVVRPN